MQPKSLLASRAIHSSRFQLSMPQHFHSGECKRHLGPAIPPCATCELLSPWLLSCGWPCRALSHFLHQHSPALPRELDAAGKFGTLKPFPGDLPQLSMWGQTELGEAKRSLEKATGKCTDTGLLTSVREVPQLNGALEKWRNLHHSLRNKMHCEKN